MINIDIYDLVKALIGLLLMSWAWIAIREINRVSKHGNRIERLEKHAITDVQLQEKLADLSSERLRLHAENTAKLDKLIVTTDGIHSQAVTIATMNVRLTAIEVDCVDIRRFLHDSVRPYVPKVIIEHDKRLDQLEGRA